MAKKAYQYDLLTSLSSTARFLVCEPDGAGGFTVNNIEFSALTALISSGETQSDKTANYTVLTGDTRKIFTNEGATGLITFTLPAATLGLVYEFMVVDSDGIKVVANGAETISIGNNTSTPTTGYIQASGAARVGFVVRLYCAKAGVWRARYAVGNWTVA